jgi:hypothetical protein
MAIVNTKNPNLGQSVHIDPNHDMPECKRVDPTYTISMPYLNPKESVEVVLFFDDAVEECKVFCRMEDVKVKIRRGGTLLKQIFDERVPTTPLSFVMALLRALIGIASGGVSVGRR